MSEIERLITLTHAFCSKFQGILMSTLVTCFVPERAQLLVVRDRNCALRLQARLVDLSMCNV